MVAPSLLLTLLWSWTSSVTPPTGATYVRELSLPVLGHQRIELQIDSSRTASLLMSGALNLHDSIGYREGKTSGTLEFALGEPTRQLLKRVHTDLREAYYDAEADAAHVVVKPPMVPAIRVHLSRVHIVRA